MSAPPDPRIPIVIGQAEHRRLPDDHVLDLVATAGIFGHAAACACCRPRSVMSEQLGALFVARARGTVRPFARVILVGTDDADRVAAALDADVLARARYRFAGRA